MSKRLLGRFYFKKTANGNLIGEYSNRHHATKRSYAESASRLSKGAGWVGEYVATWCEPPSRRCLSATLEITAKPKCVGIFVLRWNSDQGLRLFSGEAMLCDDILVGDYTDE
jgi:hypothetical protein